MCKGYSNWKDATIRIRNHELSACHREAVDMIIRLPATIQHIGQLLSRQYASETANNRRVLLKILSSLRFLARHALSFRGHDDDHDGNLIQLLKLHGEADSEVLEWLQRKSSKYLSPDIQSRQWHRKF